jgi:hypothetical protein
MNLQPGKHLPDGPLRNWQLAALFVPFSLPLLGAVLDLVGGWTSGWLPLAVSSLLLGLLAATWVVGVVRGFPVWALPALGVVLFLASYVVKLAFQGLVLFATKTPGGEFWPETIPARLSLYIWFDLAYVAIAALLVAFLLVGSPVFLGKVRKDWSLLSFLLFGLSIPYVVFNDPYQGLGPFELVSSLILAMGAALYVVCARARAAAAGAAAGGAPGASCIEPGDLSDLSAANVCGLCPVLSSVGGPPTGPGSAGTGPLALPAGLTAALAAYLWPPAGDP